MVIHSETDKKNRFLIYIAANVLHSTLVLSTEPDGDSTINPGNSH